MKTNPTRSERREEERLRQFDFQMLSKRKKSHSHNRKQVESTRERFILKSYLNITVIPLAFSWIMFSMPSILQSFDDKRIMFAELLETTASTIFYISLSLTLSFTISLFIVRSIKDLDDNAYKSYVKFSTIIILTLFWGMVANRWLSLQ